MARLFGTDGIRGVANVDLKPTLAYALGRATAHRLIGPGGQLVLGQDTRRSGDMFVAAIASGAASLGAEVHIAGTLPTPALAFIAAGGDYQAGIMVSASHNPAEDNGLKVLDANGLKLEDSIEDELEQLIWRAEELGATSNGSIGRIYRTPDRLDRYRAHRLAIASGVRTDIRVVLDCSNGSGGVVAPEILAATGAHVEVIHNEPDGANINLGCGATAPASLAEAVVDRRADLGLALDGDADRLVAVDAAGRPLDGDQLIGLLALDRLRRGCLRHGTVVVSVLSNGGLELALRQAGGQLVRTPVGDKYIFDGLLVADAELGGEKSGHVIILEHATAGDGIVTALALLGLLAREDRPLAELAGRIPLLPQQQRAVTARHKEQWDGDPILHRSIAEAERRLGSSGRVIVRPSGTEPKLRIMVEGNDAALVGELVDAIAGLASERLN